MLMSDAVTIIKPKDFHGGDRLETPTTKIASHLKRMFHWITIDVPPRLLFAAPVQLWIPMFYESKQQRCLLRLRRVNGLEQPCVGLGMQQVLPYLPLWLTRRHDSIKQNVLPALAYQRNQTKPLVVGDFKNERQAHQPETPDIVV
ncbi:hypothetical protein UG46_04545 [Pseudomonas fluorescens]|nr:hypothetical protein UG46_04545 [Pseudomonas fluorescens]